MISRGWIRDKCVAPCGTSYPAFNVQWKRFAYSEPVEDFGSEYDFTPRRGAHPSPCLLCPVECRSLLWALPAHGLGFCGGIRRFVPGDLLARRGSKARSGLSVGGLAPHIFAGMVRFNCSYKAHLSSGPRRASLSPICRIFHFHGDGGNDVAHR